MSSLPRANPNGTGPASSTTWLQRLAVFTVVASGLSIVGMLAVSQTHSRPQATNVRSVSATIELTDASPDAARIDAWRAEILAPLNVHATISDLHLDQNLLPRGETVESPSQWEANVRELLQVDSVRDRRHADNIIRITLPVGRNASQAVALVNGLAQRAVASREVTARQQAQLADQALQAKRDATTQAAQRLQQLQSGINVPQTSNPSSEAADKNSIAADAFYAERREQLSFNLAEHQRRREVLLETLLPAHPEVRDLDLKIQTMQAAIAQIPATKNPSSTVPAPAAPDVPAQTGDSKTLAEISGALGDWQKLSSEQAAAEQQWQIARVVPSYLITLAQVPVASTSAERPSTAVLSFVVLAAVAVGIASAGWIRSEPVVLHSARQIEKSLHLKVLAVLPSAGVKI